MMFNSIDSLTLRKSAETLADLVVEGKMEVKDSHGAPLKFDTRKDIVKYFLREIAVNGRRE
jgi:hypothetical protein